ncbi:hypothetical protein CJ178_30885 [Rhodococcus sp. ACPA4]|uniref:hypothetical protein n=1 Tax=Rhodococcus sp. ACPA4 TaxID=2028571 RepID=UPI000BB14102|nr:hypothetical protein [Rhodococcus sp. ACPA4]PBC35857.1 hypothetical protein CJ178_30885 [Rhodococcus sp. ACPA4]
MTTELYEDAAIRILLAEKTSHDAVEALELASALVARMRAQHRPRAALRAGLLEVAALCAAHGDEEAEAALVPLAARCGQLGLVRLLCDEGPALTNLVASLRERLLHNRWPSEWPEVDELFLSAVLASAEPTDPQLSTPLQ